MVTPLSTTGQRPVGWVAALAALSWLGEFIHNRIELPGLTVLSPENSLMAMVTIALFLLWWSLPSKRIPGTLLLILGLIHLIGGAVVSVIPFRFLPYYPEQSAAHYLTHLLYGIAQLPLILVMARQVQRTRRPTKFARGGA